jgi:hypothetical protein
VVVPRRGLVSQLYHGRGGEVGVDVHVSLMMSLLRASGRASFFTWPSRAVNRFELTRMELIRFEIHRV